MRPTKVLFISLFVKLTFSVSSTRFSALTSETSTAYQSEVNSSFYDNTERVTSNVYTDYVSYWSYYPDYVHSIRIVWLGSSIFAGTLGNLISFLVLLFTPMNKSPVSVYLMVVAWSDSIVLWWDSSFFWFIEVAGSPLHGVTRHCNVRMAVPITATFVSTWLVTILTLERLIAVWKPFKMKQWQSRQRSIWMSVVTIVVATIMFCPIYLAFDTSGYCSVIPGWETYVQYGMTWCWVIFVNILPDSLLFFANILILIFLYRSRSNFKGESTKSKSMESDSKMTYLIMTVSVTHVVLTIPYMSLYLNMTIAGSFGWTDFGPGYTLALEFTFVAAITNHAINFILYSASSQQFRNNLLYILGVCNPLRGSGRSESVATLESAVSNPNISDLQRSSNGTDCH